MPYIPPNVPLTRTEELVTDTMYGIVSGTYVGGVVAYCVEECAQLLEDRVEEHQQWFSGESLELQGSFYDNIIASRWYIR